MNRSTVTAAIFAAGLSGCFTDAGMPPGNDATSGETGGETSETGGESTGETGAFDVPPDLGTPDVPEPRALWLFDGDLTEEMVGAHAEDPLGGAVFEATPSGAGVRVGDAAYLDASAAAPLALASANAFSIAVTFNRDEAIENQHLWTLGAGVEDQPPADNMMAISISGDNQVQVFTEYDDAGTGEWVEVAPAPPLNGWATMIVVIDDGECRVFWDGEFRGAAFFQPVLTETSESYLASFRNGVTPGKTQPVKGVVDQIAFYDLPIDDETAATLSAQ